MANPSIYAAFERMWQYVLAKVESKANITHTHDKSEILDMKELTVVDDNNGNVTFDYS
jgi:hypothetical protein